MKPAIDVINAKNTIELSPNSPIFNFVLLDRKEVCDTSFWKIHSKCAKYLPLTTNGEVFLIIFFQTLVTFVNKQLLKINFEVTDLEQQVSNN
jgi:hypothetical protein